MQLCIHTLVGLSSVVCEHLLRRNNFAAAQRPRDIDTTQQCQCQWVSRVPDVRAVVALRRCVQERVCVRECVHGDPNVPDYGLGYNGMLHVWKCKVHLQNMG